MCIRDFSLRKGRVRKREKIVLDGLNQCLICIHLFPPLPHNSFLVAPLQLGAWGGVVVKAPLLVGRSRDRFPVVSLGIFFRSYRQKHVPWGRLSL